jgi:hypothetical protein
MNRSIRIVLLAGLVILFTACTSGEMPSPSPLSSAVDTPSSPLAAPSSPVATSTAPSVEPFRLDTPIVEGATRVSGSGPAGVPVVLHDITLGGIVLASGAIDANNGFEFQLNEPLEGGHRIGIALGDLSGTKWEQGDFSNESYYGEGALSVPQVGFFFDTSMVEGQ